MIDELGMGTAEGVLQVESWGGRPSAGLRLQVTSCRLGETAFGRLKAKSEEAMKSEVRLKVGEDGLRPVECWKLQIGRRGRFGSLAKMKR